MNRRIETLKDKHVNSWLSRWALGTSSQSGLDINAVDGGIKPLRTILERIMDDDRLNDRCWRAEMREVELWENERFVGQLTSRVSICISCISELTTSLNRWYY